jgi:hypothetical protein
VSLAPFDFTATQVEEVESLDLGLLIHYFLIWFERLNTNVYHCHPLYNTHYIYQNIINYIQIQNSKTNIFRSDGTLNFGLDFGIDFD